MVLKRRIESAPGTFPVGVLTTYGNLAHTGPPTSVANYNYSNPGITADVVYSEGHKGPPYRSGGGFLMSRYGRAVKPSNTFETNYLAQNYKGSIYNDVGAGGGYPSDNSAKLLTNGTKAWGNFAPTHEDVGLGQFLAELREPPTLNWNPRVPRNYVNDMRRAGRAYLNIQFGWMPFISDLMDLLQFMRNAEERLAQLRRDNGRTVRRSGTVSSSDTSSVSVKTGTNVIIRPSLATQHFGQSSKWESRTIQRTTSKYWFSAAYRYYIPKMNTPVGTARVVINKLGLNPSPHLVWEVMPWSWMADWFGTFGDVLNNLNQQHANNLTAKYAYIMGHELTTYEMSSRVFTRDGTPLTYSSFAISELKSRMAATPYGFAVKFGDLNGYQLSILGALGISRW